MARRQLIRLLPRLASGAKGTAVLGTAGIAGFAAKGISSIIKSLGIDQAVDAGEAALQTPMFEPIQRKEEVIEFRSPSVRDLFDEIEVKPKEIVPELGPEEDRYEKHLNLIIERVARLEGEAATQNELIARLRGTVKDSDDQQRRFNLEEKRKASEDDIESRNRTKEAFEKIKEGAATTGRNLAAILKALMLPIAAFTAAHMLNLFSESEEGETTLGEIADRVVDGFEIATQAGVGALQIMRGMTARGSRVARLAANPALAERAFRMAASATGAAPTGAPTALHAMAQNAGRARQATENLSRLQRIIAGLQNGSTAMMNRILDIAKRLPTRMYNFIRGVAQRLVRWYLIGESFALMFRLAQSYGMGTISEQEFHEGNKIQINRILNILGVPWIMGLLGAGVGTTVLPFIGSAAGTFIGVFIGILFGDRIYEFLRIDKIIDAIYDSIAQGDFEPMKVLFDRAVSWARNELPKLLGEQLSRVADVARDIFRQAPDMSDMDIIPGETTAVNIIGGGVEIMTEEEIRAAHSEGLITTASLNNALRGLRQAGAIEERRIASEEVATPPATEAIAQAISTISDEDVSINFSESELQQADPALYEEFTAYKQEVEQQHFEEREQRNVRNNSRIAAANRVIAKDKSHIIAAFQYQNEINSVLGTNSVVVNNQTLQNQNNVVNNQTLQNQNIITQTNREGRTVIVPVMQPAPQYGQSLSQSIATGPKSQLDSASPTYNTSDSFLDLGLVT